ncbi:unnamed protein product [Chrysoparadoxa australica]
MQDGALDVELYTEARAAALGLLGAALTGSTLPPRSLSRRTTAHKRRRRSSVRKKSRPEKQDMLRAQAPRAAALSSPSSEMSNCPSRLESHSWHAKRMVMGNRWGWCLPLRGQRGDRAAVAAALKQCVVQDKSFYRTIEIAGDDFHVADALGDLSDPQEQGWKQEDFRSGKVALDIVLHRRGSFPRGCIGPVQCLCGPLGVMWLSCHPAIFDSVLTEFSRAVGSNDMDSLSSGARAMPEGCTLVGGGLVRLAVHGKTANKVVGEVLSPLFTENSVEPGASEKKDALCSPSLSLPNAVLLGSYVAAGECGGRGHYNTLWGEGARNGRGQAPGGKCCPVQLIACHGSLVAGWVVAAPARCAVSLLKALVLAGARCIGLEEEKMLALEDQLIHFPSDYPDTTAGFSTLAPRTWAQQLGVPETAQGRGEDCDGQFYEVARGHRCFNASTLPVSNPAKDSFGSLEAHLVQPELLVASFLTMRAGVPHAGDEVCVPSSKLLHDTWHDQRRNGQRWGAQGKVVHACSSNSDLLPACNDFLVWTGGIHGCCYRLGHIFRVFTTERCRCCHGILSP